MIISFKPGQMGNDINSVVRNKKDRNRERKLIETCTAARLAWELAWNAKVDSGGREYVAN